MSPTYMKLQEVVKDLVQLKNTKNHLHELVKQQEVDIINRDNLANQLQKEYEDVVRLEKMSVRGLFHDMLGNKKEQLEKERQEYLDVAMQLKEINYQVEANQFEIQLLTPKIARISDLQLSYDSLLGTRKNEILYNVNEKFHIEVKELIRQEREHVYLDTQLKEAIDAGKLCYEGCRYVINEMEKARNWGKSTSMNYSYYNTKSAIDTALKELYQVKRKLDQFIKELKDIGIERNDLTIDVDQVVSMFNMYIGNLISDWVFQKRISTTVNLVSEIANRIEQIVKAVASEYETNRSKVGEIQVSLESYVTQVI